MKDFSLGQKLRALRKQKGTTQEDIAGLLSVTPQAVSKWERGLALPEIAHLPLLADYLDCTVDELLRNQEHRTKTQQVSWTTVREKQRFCLEELCTACFWEGDSEFESGRYDLGLMAYTRGLRALEAFLDVGKDGLEAYPIETLPGLHWRFYLHRAACYLRLMRVDDCEREIASAKEIASWGREDSVAFSDELRRLGLENIN